MRRPRSHSGRDCGDGERAALVLAVTFSVRAAGELRLRLADLLGEQIARGVTAATFYAVCARMLRDHAALFGRTDSYTIYDPADVRRIIEWLLCDPQREEIQRALADYGRPPGTEVQREVALAKNRLLSPATYPDGARHAAAPVIAEVWRALDTELARCNSFSFEDLLMHAVRLLAEHPECLTLYRRRWRHLLVDEFQDTNPAQGTLLAGPGGDVCCVGDDDQNMFGFQAADPHALTGFQARFAVHSRIVLGRNFRSRSEILHAAARCVATTSGGWPRR